MPLRATTAERWSTISRRAFAPGYDGCVRGEPDANAWRLILIEQM